MEHQPDALQLPKDTNLHQPPGRSSISAVVAVGVVPWTCSCDAWASASVIPEVGMWGFQQYIYIYIFNNQHLYLHLYLFNNLKHHYIDINGEYESRICVL